MKHHNRWLSIFFATLTWGYCSSALAQAESEDGDFQWFAAIGLMKGAYESIYLDRYSESNSEETEIKSFSFLQLELRAQYKGFYIEIPGNGLGEKNGVYTGPSLGYTLYNTENWSLDAFYGIRYGRMARRFGLRATGYFDNIFTQFILSPLSLNDDIGGYLFAASIRKDWQVRNFNIYASLGARYSSSEILNYYFGVSEQEASSTVNEYDSSSEIGSGTSINGRIGFEYPISESWVVGGVYGASKLPESVANIASDGTQSFAALSISYVF